MKITLTIPGEPMGKQRPRVCKFGTYTPAKTVNYETFIKEIYAMQRHEQQLQGALLMEVKAYFSIPKSAKKGDVLGMVEGKIRPIKRPDWDNVGKIVSDSLNGLAYHDDSQIIAAIVQKYYSDIPRVEIEIQEVEGMK
jgi:Holliday junction resolvase RusA-like endonuclease